MDTQTRKATDNLYWIVLSQLLRGEQTGAPIDYARYCAKYPKRRAVLSTLIGDRAAHHIEANKYGLTFNGLVLAKTPAARQVLGDCRRVYNAMRDVYREHVYEKKPTVSEMARSLRPTLPIERALLAVAMLLRDSGANLVADLPLTANSKLQGNQDLLEKSFTRRVKERRQLLHQPRLDLMAKTPWNPLAAHLKPTATPSDSAWLFASINELASEEAKESWAKCTAKGSTEPDGAVSAAKALVESVCKQILDRRGIAYSQSVRVPELYKQLRNALAFDPDEAPNRALQTIFQGCAAVVSGLAELRNAVGDGHGKSPGSPKASPRHSKLAVALAGALAAFLLTTDDGRKLP